MDTYAYLLERYPEKFVHAISTGAYCRVEGHWDVFPIIDVLGNRIGAAATIYAVCQSFENMGMMAGAFREATVPSLSAAEEVSALARKVLAVKEVGRKREERQGRRDRQRDQPWRKGHA
jgi:hypothetical protein